MNTQSFRLFHAGARRPALLAAGILCAAAAALGQTGGVFTENFDSAASAAANGWAGFDNESHGHAFGFRDSNHTGFDTPPGEAGGTLARSAAVAWYADLTLGGPHTLDHRLRAEGELAITGRSGFDNSIRLGFFNTAAGAAGSMAEFLGLTVNEPATGDQYRIRPQIRLSDGRRLEPGPFIALTPGNSRYRWRFEYDPNGGPAGQGRLVVEFFNSAGGSLGTRTQDLTAEQRAAGAVLDAFGLVTGGIGGDDPNNRIDLFVDTLAYAAIPPVPTTPPQITVQPRSRRVPAGLAVPLTVTAASASQPGFQWRFNGAAIPGATADTLLLPNVQAANAGAYDVIVSNPFGSVTSQVAAITLTTRSRESFASAASAAANGWTGQGNQADENSYGFSDSNHTGFGTPAGEAGGVLARAPLFSFYADTTLGGAFTLADVLQAEGELAITGGSNFDNAVLVGFLNPAGAGQTGRANFLGFTVNEPPGSMPGVYRVRPTIQLASGARVEPGPFVALTPGDSNYRWRLSYEPWGGGAGQGRLEVEFFDNAGASLGSQDVELTAEHQAAGLNVTAFGVGTGGLAPSPGNLVNLFVDELAYTSLPAPPAPPMLSATRDGDAVIIAWDPPGGALETSPVLGPGAMWSPAGAANPARVSLGAGPAFFRVSRP